MDSAAWVWSALSCGTMQNVQVSIAGGGAPPPPPGAPPTLPPAGPPPSIGGRQLPCHPQKMIAIANLALGLTFILSNIISIFASLVTLQALTVVVLLYLVLSGVALTTAALFSTQWIAAYFGFMQYPIGTGMLLIMCGALDIGTSSIGVVIGIISCICGAGSVAAHLWLRKTGSAVNVPLLRRGGTPSGQPLAQGAV